MAAPLSPTTKSSESVENFKLAYRELLHQRPGILASESGGELAWLGKARERDMTRLQTLGLPTKNQERWKYTGVKYLGESPIEIPESVEAGVRPSLASFPTLVVESCIELVFLNGHFIRSWSKLSDKEPVSVAVLSEIVEECQNNGWTSERRAKLEKFKLEVESSDADRETVFAALNTSFMQDAVLIEVGAGVQIKKPILIRELSYTTDAEKSLLTTPRIFFHAGKNCEASVIEFHAGLEGAYFSSAVTDLILEEGARITHCKIQSDDQLATHIGAVRVRQAKDSWCETFLFSIGAKLSRHDLHVSLLGEGAEVALDGLYVVDGARHVDCFTSVDHNVPHTTSRQLYKGLIEEEARAVFNGRVHIVKDAQQSNAAQLNHNLLLGAKAEVDSKPELEIDADDVKASHGMTIGKLDPEQVFYLQARAIPEDEAVQMLSMGFAQDIVFRIRNGEVRKALHAWLHAL